MALGVGAAIAAVPGVAFADTSEGGSPESSAERSQESNSGSETAPPQHRSARKKPADRDDKPSPPSRRGATRTATTDAASGDDRPTRDTDSPASDVGESAGTSDRDDRQSAEKSGATTTTTLGSATYSASPPAGAPDSPAQESILLAASASIGRPSEARTAIPSPAARRAQTSVLTEAPPQAGSTAADDADARDVVIDADSLSVSRPANGTTYTDPTASDGTALLLHRNATASTTVALPEFTSLVIRAKGDQYRGAPVMRVSVNGNVVSKVTVTATSWTDYTVPFSGPAGTYTLSIAFTNDRYSRRNGDRNLRLDTVTVVSAVVDPEPPTPPSTGSPGYFGGADWLWKPIADNPVLATNSATWVNYLAAPDKLRIANLYDYSVALVSASEITSSTPRYDVTFTEPWGSDPFGNTTVPIPLGTKVPPGSDGHVAILDPTTGLAYGIWQAKYDSSTNAWSGSWGGLTDLDGDGIDQSGSATAAAIARYAGVVTAAEFSAAIAANTGINHALAFSTDLAGPDFVYPAAKSDGQNWAGVAVPIPEGYRIQLNPDIDVDAIPGMTPGERVIAKTLQTHGAYVVDQGAARMAFAFELLDDATSTSPGSVWVDAGFAWDYYDMNAIPWSQLRVLAPTIVSV
ncbi:carbohydrate-binding domain-containing protein [Mycolicibacterium austroafricanum]|uniref:carbohydrate-binding domain-containing protein n=1 Tax=Mycolicibacterium austroafricanum TaxID=39687 RepID=UPI001F1AD3EB|nr:carbohydrate-binding domain-containing protein [Mycolicibacterium austroafricanum]